MSEPDDADPRAVLARRVSALELELAELRRAHEAKLREEKLTAVGQFAASVGHDLRNPLAAVRNAQHYINRRVLATELAKDARVQQFVALADKELKLCVRIIDNLLDFARERPIMLSACPLRAMVDDVFAVVHPPQLVTLSNQVPEAFPVPNVDRDQFKQVLVNLVTNAVEAIPPERGGEVRIDATVNGSELAVAVIDNGCGIGSDDLPRIFEPLFSTKLKGTGLGLAIVSNNVERHGGRLEVESTVGIGSTFRIRLPRTLVQPQDAAT
jgi:signal transduction histidine kinase